PIEPLRPRGPGLSDGAVHETVDGAVRPSYVSVPVRRPRGRRQAKEMTMYDQIAARPRRPWRRIGLAVPALMAPVACLAFSAAPALAIGAGCSLPASIAISGPH